MSTESHIPILALLNQLKPENNAHNSGIKRVFVNHHQVQSALTQFAHGTMQPGQESGFHAHATMDEYFYFIKGEGIYTINEQEYKAMPETFIRIGAGSKHNLKNNSTIPLEFVYFGVAL